jgi:hypothetical protein
MVGLRSQRKEVPYLVKGKKATADGLGVEVYFDWLGLVENKMVARYMHNEHLSNATFKGLNLPTIHVNKLADGSGHVLLSIEPPAALQLEVLGVWDTGTNDIVVQPLAVVA